MEYKREPRKFSSIYCTFSAWSHIYMCTKKAVYRKSDHQLPFVKPISPSLTLFHQVSPGKRQWRTPFTGKVKTTEDPEELVFK